MMEKNKILLVCGDIHGELKTLVWKVTGQYGISDANVVVAGDFGAGFSDMATVYNSVSSKLEKSGVTIYAVRGNHDDPQFFDGNHDYEYLKFCPDYKVLSLSGLEILPVGGAVSVDQGERIEWNKKKESLGSSKRVWWPGEDITRLPDFTELPRKVDLIVSHESPKSFQPVLFREENISPELYKKIASSRAYLDKIQEEVNTKAWIFGHHHKSISGSAAGDLIYRGLDIMELYDTGWILSKKEDELLRDSKIK